MTRPSFAEYLWARIERKPSGCWEWTGTRMVYGHGRTWYRGKRRLAHRAVYELLVGPVPDGLVLDHLCRNPPCVNPAHVEPVTDRENILRGVGPPAQNARKTHCHNGHPFDEANTITRPDGRECRECQREASRRYRRRQRDLAKILEAL
jgi:hypothetical protein